MYGYECLDLSNKKTKTLIFNKSCMFFNLKNDDLENAIYMFVKIETNM